MTPCALEVPGADDVDRRPRFVRHAVGVLEAGEELTRTLDALQGHGRRAGAISLTAADGQLESVSRHRPAAVGGTGFVMTGPLADHLARLAGHRERPIESLLAAWLPKRNADFLAGQLKEGRVVLWVQVDDPEEERQACGVLLDYSHQRVQVHDLPLRA